MLGCTSDSSGKLILNKSKWLDQNGFKVRTRITVVKLRVNKGNGNGSGCFEIEDGLYAIKVKNGARARKVGDVN